MTSGKDIFELDPETNSFAQLYLFKDVKNITELQTKIKNNEWKCAAINASLILDAFQVIIAANKATVSHKYNTMTTRSIYAEIIYNLSPSKKITDSLVKFGVNEGTNILVVFIYKNGEDTSHINDILPKIKGKNVDLKELGNISDLKCIKDIYKINNEASNILDVIINKIVTKNFV